MKKSPVCTLYRAVQGSLTETTSLDSPPAWPPSTLTSGRSVTGPGVGWWPTMTPMGQVDNDWTDLLPYKSHQEMILGAAAWETATATNTMSRT